MRHAIPRHWAVDQAMSPTELILDACELFDLGHVLPAAMMARAALDTFIRVTGMAYSAWPSCGVVAASSISTCYARPV